MFRRCALSLMIALMFLVGQVWASVDVYEFSSETNRQRYQKFTEELRCPLCKNSNLGGTPSQISIDLRRELHRMIEDGQTDEQIIEFMVSRYGDFVLYRPRVQRSTIALWVGPLLFISIGGLTIGVMVWRRRRIVERKEDLSESEKEALNQMLKTNVKK